MGSVLTLVIVSATLAFGAVYAWAFVPLLAIAVCLGAAGVIRQRGIAPASLAAALLLLVAAVGAQLVPIPRGLLGIVSPHSVPLLAAYSLNFDVSGQPHPISINPSSTLLGLLGLSALALYGLGLPALLSRSSLGTFARNIMIFGVVLALIGIYGKQHNNGLVYGFWQPIEGSNGNGFGPFVNRNHFAGWMLMATCLAIGTLLARWERGLSHMKPGARNRIVWLSSTDANRLLLMAVAIIVMAVSLVWTLSRSGIVSFTCAIVCFVWLLARRRSLGTQGKSVAVVLAMFVLAASVAWRGVDILLGWFGDTRDLVGRFGAWQDGWQVVKDFVLTGTGINTYRDAMIFYQRHELTDWMSHAHNDYLQLLAEGGLLVAVPTAIAIVVFARTAKQNLALAATDSSQYWIRAGAVVGLLAIAVQETAEFSLHIPANAFLFATLAAVAITPLAARRDGRINHPRPKAD